MAISYGKVANRVFSIVKGFGHKIQMFDDIGNTCYNPSNARRFYIHSLNTMVTVHEDGENSEIGVHISENVDIQVIERLLNSLRTTANHYAMSFATNRYGHTITPRSFAYIAKIKKDSITEETVMEKMSGYKRVSHQRFGNCRVIVRHSSPINDQAIGARGRNIESVYVENDKGERFLMPQPYLNGGRAMARHLSEGGTQDDEIGTRIKSLVNEIANLRGVSQYITVNIKVIGDNDDTRYYRDLITNRVKEINAGLKNISCVRDYRDNHVLTECGADTDLIQTERDKIISTLHLDECNDSFDSGITSLAAYSMHVNPPETTVGDSLEMLSFNEWLEQFDPSVVLKESPAASNEEENDDDIFNAGDSVTVIPTPPLNKSMFPQANWIREPTTVLLQSSVTKGSLEIAKCTVGNDTKTIYGFNISEEATQTTDPVWETAAFLIANRYDQTVMEDAICNMNRDVLASVHDTITETWDSAITTNVLATISRAMHHADTHISQEWSKITHERARPVILEFRTPVDLIMGLKRIGGDTNVDYRTLSMSFTTPDACMNAARILKKHHIKFNEDVFGGDMGDDLIRDISTDYAQKHSNDTTPRFTQFGYEVDSRNMGGFRKKLDAANIQYSIDGTVFFFGSLKDRKKAEELNYPG